MVDVLIKNKTIIIAVIIAVLAVGAVYLWKQNKQPANNIPTNSSLNNSPQTTEGELKALQRQLDQLLKLQEQLERESISN